mmetsp:Transcript_13848/g.31408  ORF Transcript_13848/g.31408 Transcript_13848/m.31408 type:complete len:211 (-) Transcript_13848:126-758(-)
MTEQVVPQAKPFLVQAWSEFFFNFALKKPAEHKTRLARVKHNFGHYRANYAILGGCILGLVFGYFVWIILLFVGLVWYAYFSLQLDEPAWKPLVLGMELTADSRWTALCCCSACLLFHMTWHILWLSLGGLCYFWYACLYLGPFTPHDIAVLFIMTNRHLVLLVHIGLCFFWHAFLNTGPCAPYEREEAPQAVGPKVALADCMLLDVEGI